MIVTCERCATQFQLDDSRVPECGVRVRCSRCKNSFRVTREEAAGGDEMADVARRTRAGGEEVTQDIPEERSGSRPERSAGAARSSGRAAEKQTDSTSATDAEESDWEFNNNTNGDFDRGAADSADADAKPEMPEVAPSRGRLADDWFGGGAGDAPLELEDRSSQSASSSPSVAVAPPLRPQPAPSAPTRAPLPPVPVREPTPATPPPREAVTAPASVLAREPEPEAEPDLGLELASEPAASPPRESVSVAPSASVERRAPKDPADELSTHTWGDLLAAAEDTEPPAPRTAGVPALRSQTTLQLSAWLGRFGHALGAGLTLALFCAGLLAGLVRPEQIDANNERVAGLELESLEARYVENASAGNLLVVSGRVRNPGNTAVSLGRLTLGLFDAQGHALEGAMLHAPSPVGTLREGAAAELAELPRLTGEVRPGEVRSFEALVVALPAQAREFRIVESQTPPPG